MKIHFNYNFKPCRYYNNNLIYNVLISLILNGSEDWINNNSIEWVGIYIYLTEVQLAHRTFRTFHGTHVVIKYGQFI